MVGARDQDEGIAGDDFSRDVSHLRLEGHDRAFDLPVRESLDESARLLLEPSDPQAWDVLAQLRRHLRQQVRGNGRDDAQPDRARKRISDAPGCLEDLVGVAE